MTPCIGQFHSPLIAQQSTGHYTNSSNRFHVYVIGGGPAGSATALSMIKHMTQVGSDQLTVHVVTGPVSSKTAIGETVPPIADHHLHQLGLAPLDHTDHLPCPGSLSVWGQDQPGYNDFSLTPIGQGHHLNRKLFNASLLDAAEAQGAAVMEGAKLLAMRPDGDGYELTLESGGEVCQQHADFVVDATGIQAKVARSLGVARNQYDAVISCCHVFPLNQSKPSASKGSHTLVAAVEQGWWYGTELPKQKALISFCTDKQTLKKGSYQNGSQWMQLLQSSGWFYQQCTERMGIIPEPESLALRVSPSAILSNVIGPRWLAVGDAACSYDSMTSAGITKALEQGLLAGEAIVKRLFDDDAAAMAHYQDRVFAGFNEYLNLHQTLYRSERRFPKSAFWYNRRFQKL